MKISILLTHITFAIVLVIVSFLITWVMCHKIGIMDEINERSSHDKVVPRAGGIAIVITFLIGMMTIYFLGDKSHIKQEYMQGFIFSSFGFAAFSMFITIPSSSLLCPKGTSTVFPIWS